MLANGTSEQEVREIFRQRAEENRTTLNTLPHSWEAGRIDARRLVKELKRNNFLALVPCLMMGTAALPHIRVHFSKPACPGSIFAFDAASPTGFWCPTPARGLGQRLGEFPFGRCLLPRSVVPCSSHAVY